MRARVWGKTGSDALSVTSVTDAALMPALASPLTRLICDLIAAGPQRRASADIASTARHYGLSEAWVR